MNTTRASTWADAAPRRIRRALIIGCGHAGRRHARCLAAAPGLEALTLCDLDAARHEATRCALDAARHEAARCALDATRHEAARCDLDAAPRAAGATLAVTTDVDAALRDQEHDLIVIATPSGHHVAHALAALDAAPAATVLLEKPTATRRGDLERLARRLRREPTGRLLSVQPLRMQPTFQAALAALRARALGTLLTAEVSLHLPRGAAYFVDHPWHGCRELDGGPLLNQAYHLLDAARCWLGPLEPVASLVSRRVHPVSAGDTAAALARSESGVALTVSVTLGGPTDRPPRGSLRVCGARGALALRGPLLDRVASWPAHLAPPPAALTSNEALHRRLHAALRAPERAWLDDGLAASRLAIALTDLGHAAPAARARP